MIWLMALFPFLMLLASAGFIVNLALDMLTAASDNTIDIQPVEVVNHADLRPR